MAEIIENSRELLPVWAAAWLPQGDDSVIRAGLVEWLRTHAQDLRKFGGDAGRGLLHFIIGIIIGSFIALREARPHQTLAPLAQAMCERVHRLGDAFRRVVFAQVRISALNALLTGIYLLLVLPAFGVQLPFTKTMIIVTFVVGLLPVLGNLISNTVIVVISLSHSLHAAAGSLAFLVIIHKLEYFVNARIIGGQIQARAWELLIAMLVMEAAFGVPGRHRRADRLRLYQKRTVRPGAYLMSNDTESLVITASGEDKIGLVEGFTRRISESGCNIEESRMAALGGRFALLMRVTGSWDALAKLEGRLPAVGEELGLAIIQQRTRPTRADKPLIPYTVEVAALDQPGIVNSLANFFARLHINIEALDTETYPAPHTGAPMFAVHMTLGIPADAHIATLRGDFLDYCDDQNLDATFEPVRM